MSNSSIWHIDSILSVLQLWAKVDLGAMAMKGYSAFSKSPVISPSDYLVSYPGNSLEVGLTYLKSCSGVFCNSCRLDHRTLVGGGVLPHWSDAAVYFAAPTDWPTGHSLVRVLHPYWDEAVYFAAPTDWPTGHSLVRVLHPYWDEAVYFAAPSDWPTGHSLVRVLLLYWDAVVYSPAPADWAIILLNEVNVTLSKYQQLFTGS